MAKGNQGFYMPTRVYQGRDCVREHSAEIAKCGKKALIVTGRHSAEANGSLKDVIQSLEAEGVEYIHFSEVEENPSTDTVMKARKLAIEEACDFVIGIGGGSPLDAAKAIALMVKNSDWSVEKLYEANNPSDALPVIAIPTTCGTGSEVTGVSVLTRRKEGLKGGIPYRIFPGIALIDGKYLIDMPHHILCNTAIDALAHMWESYINSGADTYSRMCVDAGLRIWAENQDILLGKCKPSREDLDRLMMASTFAGMSIAQDGTSIPHGMSYPLTMALNIPHGVAVGYFLGGYVAKAKEKDRNHVLKLAGFNSVEEYQAFYEKVCPIREPIPKEILLASVDAIDSNSARKTVSPYPITREDLMEIAGVY